MTAISKCPNDEFYMAFVSFAGTTGVNVSLVNADDEPVKGAVKHMWVGRNLGGGSKAWPMPWQHPDTYIAVLRASDGKLVVPKGVNADGVTTADISGTKRRACQLFAQNSKPLRFANFPAVLTADGSKVVKYRSGAKPNDPERVDTWACEEYSEVPGYVLIGGATTAVGKMTDVYKPPSCLFVIDDCSK